MVALSPKVRGAFSKKESKETQRAEQVFPNCYKWATFPICIMLGKLFEVEKARTLSNPVENPNPFFVELVSTLERALAYATTGNGRVLHRGTMEGTFLSKGLLTTGYPGLDRKLYRRPDASKPYGVFPEHWPVSKKGGENTAKPESSTANGLTYHFNKEAALVSDKEERLVLSS